MPPWGFWPLAPIGVALHLLVIREVSRRARGWGSFAFGFGWFGPACGWMFQLTAPGFPIAIAIFSSYVALAAAYLGGGKRWWLVYPAAFTIAEGIRFCFPFGGVPVASLAISQVAGPLAGLARIGGPLLLSLGTFGAGAVLASLAQRRVWPAAGWLAVLVATAALGAVAPNGTATGTSRVALVQGGGPQGTRAVSDDPEVVYQRHLDADATIVGPVDLVVWPENVIVARTGSFANSSMRDDIARRASQLNAPYAVGITEDLDDKTFINGQVVVQPDGTMPGRYDKVRRVPFGEYMPFRSVLEALPVGAEQVPRDAKAGVGPAVMDVPGIGKVGVVISWEVFFAGRTRDATRNGGTFIVNPTNGASYVGTILQSQQVASSRLRAIETGRWIVQVSPTGFSAFVDPDGNVLQRTAQIEAKVLTETVERRTGLTWANRIGDTPWMVLCVALVGLARTPFKRR